MYTRLIKDDVQFSCRSFKIKHSNINYKSSNRSENLLRVSNKVFIWFFCCNLIDKSDLYIYFSWRIEFIFLLNHNVSIHFNLVITSFSFLSPVFCFLFSTPSVRVLDPKLSFSYLNKEYGIIKSPWMMGDVNPYEFYCCLKMEFHFINARFK